MINVNENIISENQQNILLNSIEQGKIPFFYNEDSGIKYSKKEILRENTEEFPMFTHTFIRNGFINSSYFILIKDICLNIENKIHEVEKRKLKLDRAKININTRKDNIDTKKHFHFHIDADESHYGYTAIYYTNNSDGDTLFYDNGKIIKSITPKKGMAVFFNNNIYHAGKPPRVSNGRFILNINWIL